MIDKWEVTYEENPDTGELNLVEKCTGLTRVEKTENQTYLGFVISDKGNNLANIESIKKKANGVLRKIFNRLNCLKLNVQ